MNLYILPVQRVLLEYVLKLGDMIFFPGDVSDEAIEYSNLLDDEKEKLRLIVEHNRSFDIVKILSSKPTSFYYQFYY